VAYRRLFSIADSPYNGVTFCQGNFRSMKYRRVKASIRYDRIAVMIIRAQQMQVFEAAAMDQFAREMCAHLRAALPEATRGATEVQLQEAVRKAIGESQGFGIDGRFDIQQYLQVVFELGYLTHAERTVDWARDFLQDPEISASDKVNRLEGEAMLLGKLPR
jgi:D-mannonate dehydratase